MRTVIGRLALLVDDDTAAYWYPRFRLTFRSAALRRIDQASEALSLRHMYHRVNLKVVAALRTCTTEMDWFRRYPGEIKSAGIEKRWGEA